MVKIKSDLGSKKQDIEQGLYQQKVQGTPIGKIFEKYLKGI